MPKAPSTTIKMFRVRIDGADDEPIKVFVQKHCSKWLLVHHTTETENPHYHFYAETHFTQGNFSNKIKDELKVKGGDYSNKSCDLDRRIEFLSYLFNTKKGNKWRVVSYHQFGSIDLHVYQSNSKEVEREFQSKMKQKKKTQYDVVEAVLERMPSEQLCFHVVVYDHVVEVMKAMRIMARPYHIRDIIATIMAYGDNKQAKQQIKDLSLKFFYQ